MNINSDTLALSAEDAARAAGVCTNTIRRAIMRGELKAKKLGGRLLILRGDLLAFLERQPDAQLART